VTPSAGFSSHYGWAIEHRMPGEPPALCGRFYFVDKRIPAQLLGYRIAVFDTRAQAMAAKPRRWRCSSGGFCTYRIVKVSVAIKVCG
jgi:hypothetical protein